MKQSIFWLNPKQLISFTISNDGILFQIQYILIVEEAMLSKNNKSLINTKDPSLQYLTTLNRFMDAQQKNSKNIHKEIKNEVQQAKKKEKKIEKSLQKINEQGEALICRYEEEKQINQKLEMLVKDLEEKLYQMKLDRLEELKSKGQTDKLSEIKSILKAREKELEKIIQKTNNSSYQLSKKMDNIRALRSQRTIVSALLDKIERELCSLEHCYKVLVIQRHIEEHEYQEKLQEFKECQNTTWKQIQKIQHKKQKMETQNSSVRPTMKGVQEPEIQFKRQSLICSPTQPTEPTEQQRGPTRREIDEKTKAKNKIYEQELKKIKIERRVKDIFNDLGINQTKQIPSELTELEKNNQKLFEEASQMLENIDKTESLIASLSKKKKVKGKLPKQVLEKNKKKAKIAELKQEVSQNRRQINQFNRILKVIYQSHSQSNQNENSASQFEAFFNEQEEISFYMAMLENFLIKLYKDPVTTNEEKRKSEVTDYRRLSQLFQSNVIEKNNMTIYAEEDLMKFAKKNMQAVKKTNVRLITQ